MNWFFPTIAMLLLLAGWRMLHAWKTMLDLPGFRRWCVLRFGWPTDMHHAAAPPSLRLYLGPAVSFLARTFAAAWLFWILFYVVLSIDEFVPGSLPHKAFWLNVMTNGTTYCLILFYFKLSAPRDRNVASWEFRRVLLAGWLFLILAFTTFEFLTVFREHVVVHNVHGTGKTFKVVYGLAQGLAIFLIVGRLESASIRDHIEYNGSKMLLFVYKMLLLAGYAYAAIQPLYPAFEEDPANRIWPLLLMALVGKLALLLLFHLLCLPISYPTRIGSSPGKLLAFLFGRDRKRKGLSSLEHHLYEMERFTIEELSFFERDFLRKHFGHVDRQRGRRRLQEMDMEHQRTQRNSSGIEYAYLNDFKRAHLGLADEAEGGVWVKKVLASGARDKGMRMGDYVTHIDDVPIGRNNRLSELLEGYSVEDEVKVAWLSPRPIEDHALPVLAYDHKVEHMQGAKEGAVRAAAVASNGASLGLRFKHNSPDHGVVCTWPGSDRPFTITGLYSEVDDQYFHVPDVHMLRMVLSQLNPGGAVRIHGTGLVDLHGRPANALRTDLRGPTDHGRIDEIAAAVRRELKEDGYWAEGADPIAMLPEQWKGLRLRAPNGWPVVCLELRISNGRLDLSAVARPECKAGLRKQLFNYGHPLLSHHAGRRMPRTFTFYRHPRILIDFDAPPDMVAQAIKARILGLLEEPRLVTMLKEVAERMRAAS